MGENAGTRYEINDNDDVFFFLVRELLFVLARVLDGVLPVATPCISNDLAKTPWD